jgi:hypothetical protein
VPRSRRKLIPQDTEDHEWFRPTALANYDSQPRRSDYDQPRLIFETELGPTLLHPWRWFVLKWAIILPTLGVLWYFAGGLATVIIAVGAAALIAWGNWILDNTFEL